MTNIFITGHSSGLGLGLSRYYLQQGKQVYGLSRSNSPIQHPDLHQSIHDLAQLDQIDVSLQQLLPDSLDLVILNAGILGKINDLADTSLQEARTIMDVNVWANKLIIDWLIRHQVRVKQLIIISSGASINGNRGWGVYSISKASVNMMAQLYADEMPDTHITAYAPGLVHTKMQDYLCRDVDTRKFTSIGFLVKAYNTEAMPDIDSAAERIANSFVRCLTLKSGSFADIHQL